MLYRPSDEVVCKIRDNRIVQNDAIQYDRTDTFEVVALTDGGYFLFVRNHMILKDSFKHDFSSARNNKHVNTRFADCTLVKAVEEEIVRLYRRHEGTTCDSCGEFKHLAESNLEGGLFICYLCRQDPYR